jgi:hypothetical protein
VLKQQARTRITQAAQTPSERVASGSHGPLAEENNYGPMTLAGLAWNSSPW